MSRSRRVSVDGNGSNPGSNWQLPIYLDLDLGNPVMDYQVVQLQGYGVDIGAPERVTTLTIWADGLISFGAPTATQIAFMRGDYPNGADVFGFPGDFVSLGPVGPDLPAAFTQDSSYGLFIDFGTLEDQSTGAQRDIRGELLITSDGRLELDGGEDSFNSRIAFRVNGLRWDPTVDLDQPQPDTTLAYQIIGTDGRQTLIGGDASETIIGKGGSDLLTGGGGTDSFKYLAVSDSPEQKADRIYDFQTGVDRIDATALGTTGYAITRRGALYLVELYTASGTLQISSDNLVAARDVRIGNAITLAGGTGRDTLAGLDGDDTITGGGGADLLTGNAGRDTFRFTAFTDSTANRRDVITDFVSGTDHFDFGALAITNYSITADGGASIVTLQNGAQRLSVRVEGTISRADLVTSITQTLSGTNNADTLQALNNGSILQGLNGNDTLTGFGGIDQLNGGNGRDVIDGGDGDDVIIGGAGGDVLTGGYGMDTFRYAGTADSIVTITNPGAADPIYDLSQTDRLTDVAFGDLIDVSTLRITAVQASLVDPDTFLLRLDTPDGIFGLLVPIYYIDTAIEAISYGKSIVATGEILEGLDGNDRLTGTSLSGHAGDDILTGTAANDRLDGGADDDLLIGGAGNDLLIGGGGTNVARGNAGNDTFDPHTNGTFDGGDGNDVVDESFLSRSYYTAFGGAGNDRLNGTLSGVRLWGGSGDDSLTAGHGLQAVVDLDDSFQPYIIYDPTFALGDEMHGGGGNDNIVGGEGDDVAYGDDGDDYLFGGNGFDAVTGFGSGFDFAAKDGGADRLFGGAGNDTIDGGTGADLIEGGDGADFLSGGTSADFAYRHDGAADVVRGGAGDDMIYGVGEGDLVDGGAGNDRVDLDFTNFAGSVTYALADGLVTTNTGTFTLVSIESAFFSGGSEDDILTGGAGADSFSTGGYDGYGGADVLNGAGGDDLFYQYGDNTAVRSIDGGDGNDQLSLSFSYGAAGVDFSLLGGSSISFASGGRLNYAGIESVSVYGTSNGDVLTGGNFNDTLAGQRGNDTLNGGGGDDYLSGGFGTNTLNGGDGTDRAVLSFYSRPAVVFTLSSSVVVTDYYGTQTLNSIEAIEATGSDGGDRITGGDGANTIYGQSGNDVLTGGAATDLLYGGGDSDTLNGLGGDDTLYGDALDDSLNGGAGRDRLYGGDGTDTLDGGDGDDVVDGGAGEDTLTGGAGVDTAILDFTGLDAVDFTLTSNATAATALGTKFLGGVEAMTVLGTAFADRFVGGAGGDTISASDGDDVLRGLGGNDLLIGGEGADTLDGGEGFDGVDYADTTDPVTLSLFTGRAAAAGVVDTLVGIEHARGSVGGDTLIAGARPRPTGDIVKPQGGPALTRLDGAFSRTEDAEIAQSTTIPHATVIATASGNLERYAFSVIDAGSLAIFDIDATTAGIDTVIGLYDESGTLLASNDDASGDPGSPGIRDSFLQYAFARAGDYVLVVSAYGGGPLAAGSGYALNVSIENKVDYWLEGEGGDDRLVGGSGSDRLDGGAGEDSVAFNGAAAVTVDLAAGTARGQGEDMLSGIEIVQGSNANDVLRGDAGANTLDGRGGADAMAGRAGDDVYVVDNESDTVIEAVGEGADTVRTSVSYALASGQEIETLTVDDLSGIAAIVLAGNEFDNILVGNAGNNRLNGGRGADTMSGGLGDDVYYVDDAGDRVIDADGGDDRVYTSRNFTLVGSGVERLYAVDPAATSALVLTGNFLANTIVGNAGNNTLDGGYGDDRLTGGLGNDTYYVESSADRVFEAAGGGTNDRVFTTVDYTLGRDEEIERLNAADPNDTTPLALTGNRFVNVIYGNAGDNKLDGGAGADRLVGGAGDDSYIVDDGGDRVIEAVGEGRDRVTTSVTFRLGAGQEIEFLTGTGAQAIDLTGNEFDNAIQGNGAANRIAGGLGADRLSGGAGADTFVFDTALRHGNVDRIVDFVGSAAPVHDLIALDDTVFKLLAPGALSADAFKVIGGGSVIDADDRILYDAATGALFYDVDGSGARAAIQFATLTGAPTLTAADIMVI